MNLEKKIETIRLKIRRKYMHNTSNQRQKKIHVKDFTIISNNCWGGFIYQSYSLKYNSPTIGLFFVAEDYIKFISNFKNYINMDLIEVNYKNSKWYDILKNNPSFGCYPIGKLGDIEIHFLHYKTFFEAKEKWNIRKSRINFERIIFKFSEMNYCTEDDIKVFQNLPLENKICFVTKKFKNLTNEYTFVVSNKKKLTASYEPFGNSKIIDINDFINNLK